MKRIEFKNEDIQTIISLYRDEQDSMKAIGAKFNVDQGVIKRVLTENNIIIRKKTPSKKINKILDNYVEEQIVAEYLNNKKSLGKIAAQFGISQGKVETVLKQRGIQKRTYVEAKQLERKYFVNDNYFKYQNSNMAYILGLLASEGNIAMKENCISLELHAKDCEILEKIKMEVASSRDIKYYTNSRGSELCKFQVWSSEWKKDLAVYNIIPNKTFNLLPPTFLDTQYYIDYIRGYFDGDGSIWHHDYSNYFEITGASKPIINWIREILANQYGVTNPQLRIEQLDSGVKMYKTSYGGKEKFQKIYDILYTPNSLYLQRKKEKFETLLGFPRDSITSERSKKDMLNLYK